VALTAREADSTMQSEQLLPDLWRFHDSCNVYVLRDGNHAVAVDFGSGAWLAELAGLGITHLDHVFLTHSHLDQCQGLHGRLPAGTTLHAPVTDRCYLDPQRDGPSVRPPWFGMGCPPNYDPPVHRIPGVSYDLAGNSHVLWRGRRVRFLDTPGHTAGACTVLVDHDGRQVAFCGDAAHAGGTIWQPFHLEWYHTRGQGVLAAWEGIVRLQGLHLDRLCPSHGPVIAQRPRVVLRQLAGRLMELYHAKCQISPGAQDRYLPAAPRPCGALEYSPHLFQFGSNGYLLLSDGGEALVVDPTVPDMPVLEALLAELGNPRPTAATVTHVHSDHCDAIPYLREKHATAAYLHPLVAEPWRDPTAALLPWMLPDPIEADHLWPDQGCWRWQEYEFEVAPWPGQTWWHCAFMTVADGKKVLFAGDSFTPPSKWYGTGGFCAYNGSRFSEGFVASVEQLLRWAPDVMAAGHTNTYRFSAARFRRVLRWAVRAEAAVRALCPSGDLEQDYYAVHGVIRRNVAAGDAAGESRARRQRRWKC
jgi:glyoxylase-like metal-dependent hydrolase (beta-lactamase superfamily II)